MASGFPPRFSENQVLRRFGDYGTLTAVNYRRFSDRCPEGSLYVQFASAQDANRARDGLAGQIWDSQDHRCKPLWIVNSNHEIAVDGRYRGVSYIARNRSVGPRITSIGDPNVLFPPEDVGCNSFWQWDPNTVCAGDWVYVLYGDGWPKHSYLANRRLPDGPGIFRPTC